MSVIKSLWFKVILSVVLVMTTLSVLLIYVGYREISDSIEKQYEDTAFRTAQTALSFIDADRLSDYNDLGGDFYEETMELDAEWRRLVNTQTATFAYAIQPDVSKNYTEIRFVLSTMNENFPYDRFHSGHIRPTSSEEYRQAYEDLYNHKKMRATIIRDNGVSATGDHITVMLPIKNAAGEVKGILCVQRQMEDLRITQNFYLRHMIAATLAVLLLMLLIQGSHLRLNLLDPLKALTNGVNEISGGNMEKKLDIKTGDELEKLAGAFNVMTDELQTYNADYRRERTYRHRAQRCQRNSARYAPAEF